MATIDNYTYTGKVKAVRYEVDSGDKLPGFRYYRADITGKTEGHAIFDTHLKEHGILCRIVLPGEWILYFPDGAIKSMSDSQFVQTFTKE